MIIRVMLKVVVLVVSVGLDSRSLVMVYVSGD